jgi:ABC-type microcin C transport system duplicated ATPase subunit YejF
VKYKKITTFFTPCLSTTYRTKSEVRSVAVFFPLFFVFQNAVCQGDDELLGSEDVLTLVRHRGDNPIRVAEVPVLAGALEPTTVIGVQVDEVDDVWSALGANQEACRAVEELAVKRLRSKQDRLMRFPWQ